MSEKRVAELAAALLNYPKTHRLEFYKPYGFQQRFHNAIGHETGKPARVKCALTANQVGKCVSIRQNIPHPDGTSSTVGELYERGRTFQVLAWNGERLVTAVAMPPFKKPAEPIYRVWLASGEWFECAANHRVLCADGWHFVGQLLEGVPALRRSGFSRALSVLREDGRHWWGRLRGWLAGCPADRRSGDGRLRSAAVADLVFAPSLAGVQQRSPVSSGSDAPASRHTSSGRPVCDRLSSSYARHQTEARCAESAIQDQSTSGQPGRAIRRVFQRLSVAVASRLRSSVEGRSQGIVSLPALLAPGNQDNRIVAYDLIGTEDIYDFTVPGYGNYYASGVVHHNSTGAAAEMAMHLTGRYPDWYTGLRFVGPVKAICAGVTNELTRDICQQLLFGDPTDPRQLGTGMIPKDCIGRQTRKAGVPDALEIVRVKHSTGRWSTVQFKCYEQGPEKFMGIQAECAWLDEEPPQPIFSQIKRAGFAKVYSVILLTFTPEKGMTEVVNTLFDALPPGYALVQATWDDAPHMTPEMRTMKLADVPLHERDMRSKGTPFAGAGLVFPVTDESIVIDPIPIPRHWRRIIGIDFGWSHPFAAASLAHDSEKDCVYLTGEYHEQHATPPVHCAAIRPWTDGGWVPIVWPQDGLQTQKGEGRQLIMQYRAQPGLYFLPQPFTNPPNYAKGEEEGDGGYHVEPGLIEMLTRMQTGRFKVFRTCQKFMQEKRTYHRDEHGRIVPLLDDMISATRIATMSLRHARTKPVRQVPIDNEIARGASNW